MIEAPVEEKKGPDFGVKVSVARVGDVRALVDTGACISLVRRDALSEALLGGMAQWKRAPLCGAGDRAISPLGTVALSIRLGAKVVDISEVAVVESCPYPLLLGSDYLEKVGGFINCSTGELVDADVEPDKSPSGDQTDGKEEGTSLPATGVVESMHVKAGERACCVVEGDEEGHIHCGDQRFAASLSASVVVPARTTAYVGMEVGLTEGREVVVEQKLHCQPGKEWAVPRSIVRVARGLVHLPVTNLTSKELKLKKTEVKLKAFEIADVEMDECLGVGERDFVGVIREGEGVTDEMEDARMGANLSALERDRVREVLAEFSSCFRRDGLPVAKCNGFVYEHRNDTGVQRPVAVCPRRKAPAERKAISQEVAEMLELGVIEPASGPWSSPVVLVKKKDGAVRFCVDYRRLNEVTVKTVYPLPRLDDVLNRLGGATLFTTLDMYKGYWQVPMAEVDRPKTAFVTPDGLFQFTRMSFGLCNAPASFQRMMDTILGPLKWKVCLVYMDDILIFSRSFEEHLDRLALVLDAVRRAGLLLQVKKCLFASDTTKYLGHVLNGEGIAPDPEKVEAIVKFPVPRGVRELRRFLGMASFYRRFVRGFAVVANPLTALLKKEVPWTWGRKEEEAFRCLLARLSESPVLAHLDENADLTMRTDASVAGLGAVLSQGDGSDERVMAYLSKTLSAGEAKWVPNDLECYAIVWAVDRWRPYLYGKKVTIKTDSQVARALTTRKELKGKHARWVEQLSELAPGLVFEHCSGASNVVADALSRAPVGPIRSSQSPVRDTPRFKLAKNKDPQSSVSGDGRRNSVVALVAVALPPPVPRKVTFEEFGLRQRADGALAGFINTRGRRGSVVETLLIPPGYG